MADTVCVAAISDLHYDKQSKGALRELFDHASDVADVLLLCEDLTTYGLAEEADILAQDLRAHVKIPVLDVLGNHDFESDQPEAIRETLEEAGVQVLDGEATVVAGIGFAGVRGFGGGFGQQALNAWGESVTKQFVQEGVGEALKLEAALARLDTRHRIALLHYAPIRATVEGEPPEIFPFLGSSRLEDTLNRYEVTAAFHGHAHHGTPEGRTAQSIPVYNVSLPVLRQAYPDRPPFCLFEVDSEA